MTKYLLLDNGSLKPAATLTLRRLAEALGQRAGVAVDAVSLQHAAKIDAASLDGKPARILRDYLAEELELGCRHFVLVPLFFGQSRAITGMIPDIQAQLQQQYGAFSLQLADVLFAMHGDNEKLTQILLDNIHVAHGLDELPSAIVLVDHGSPSPRVTEVRQRLAHELQQKLGDRATLQQAAMERRSGREYDFNGMLLGDWLQARAAGGVPAVVVSLLFLSPGRHAGAGGDIESICQRVEQQNPGFRIHLSPLLSDHPGLVELLYQRLADCMTATAV